MVAFKQQGQASMGFRTPYLGFILFAFGNSIGIADAQTLVVDKPAIVNLQNVSMVIFDLPSQGAIASYENVTPGKLYVFYFANSNTMLTDQNALLANGSARTTFGKNTSVLFVGENLTSVRQVADGVTSR